MLLSHSLKCCPCSCGCHLLSDIALLAWAVASITLIYPLPWGLDMIIGVKYSFGAALFINRLHTILFPLSAVEVSCLQGCLSTKSLTRRDKIQFAPAVFFGFGTSLLQSSGYVISAEQRLLVGTPDSYLKTSSTKMLVFKLIFSCNIRKLLFKTQKSEGI